MGPIPTEKGPKRRRDGPRASRPPCMTSQLLEGRVLSDFEMLSAKMASAWKRTITNQHFRRKVNVEEQTAQKYDRFLRGRQIACVIYDHFRATGACDAAQDLSVLFNIYFHDDDIHDFDTRWGRSSVDNKRNTSGECP